jgi:hypothetical protein
MAIKYWRIRLKGERSADDIQSAIGQSGGEIVRIHFEGGETHVYYAAGKSAAPKAAKAMRKSAIPEEISAREVTKIK